MLRNLPICSFAPFLIVLLTPFINKPGCSRDLIIFMISFKSSFENTYIAVPNPTFFVVVFWVAASLADATVVNPNDIKTVLANGSSNFPIKGKPVFSNGPRSLLRNPPNYTILER